MPGTFQQLRNSPGGGFFEIGGFAASSMLLLTDGTVMCQQELSQTWRRLTPDETGSYLNGTWSDMPPSVNSREYFASAVLADGRVIVAGGEYQAGILGVPVQSFQDTVEIFDPVMNNWTPLSTPGFGQVGDASACLLADGRWLVGDIGSPATAIFDPATGQWTPAASKASRCDEETWTLLPDGSVLTVQTFSTPNAERFVPNLNQWLATPPLPFSIVDVANREIGPAVLLPDGRALCMGATGSSVFFLPSGSWAAGPSFVRASDGRTYAPKDAPACLLPNGRVLVVAGPAAPGVDIGDPAFFEFDGSSFNFLQDSPFNAPINYIYRYRMLLLPTGQVLISWAHPTLFLFTPDSAQLPGIEPVITHAPSQAFPGGIIVVRGLRFNGVSQAVSYGDDYQAATNYPLVRLQSGSRVIYCRTFNFSSTGVATGTMPVSTSVEVPTSAPPGEYQLQVVSNGTASSSVAVTVGLAGWAHADLSGITGAPAASVNGPLVGYSWEAARTKQLVYLASDGHIHELVVQEGQAWSHADLSNGTGALASVRSGGLAAYAWERGNSKQVTYITDDGHIHELFVVQGGSWTHADLTGITGSAVASPHSRIAAYAWEGAGTKQVVYMTGDGHVHELSVPVGGAWSHNDLTAIAGAPAAARNTSISAYAWEGGRTKQVIYMTEDGHIHELFVRQGGSWASADLTSIAHAPTALTSEAIVGFGWERGFTWEGVHGRTPGGSKHVVYLDGGRALHVLSAMPGVAWTHTAVPSDGIAASGAPVSLDSYAWDGGGSLQAAYALPDGRIHEVFARLSVPWSNVELTAPTGAPRAAPGSPIAAYAWEVGTSKQVAYIANDGHIHELFI